MTLLDSLTVLIGVALWWLIPLLLWTAIWKGIALWKAGRNNQLGWFVAIFVLNTAGILPILYILLFRKKK